MEERVVGIQTLVSHYKYPCHHKVSTREENRNIFCFCFSKFKEEKMSDVWIFACSCVHCFGLFLSNTVFSKLKIYLTLFCPLAI